MDVDGKMRVRKYIQTLTNAELHELVSEDTTPERFDEIMSGLKIFPDGCDPEKSVFVRMDYGEGGKQHDKI